ncbi:CHAD domain-containing protein [Ginsengibacter hankyongi]|nr:CHAD domain-containing protein [Ginsengibacter hankyongi]
MTESEIRNIINNHYRQLNKFIRKVNKHFEPESIHRLRVEYKKLRAFLRMISVENDCGKKIKISKKLKNAYHVAGEIRDLQLQHQRMLAIKTKEINPTGAYHQLLERNINKLKGEFASISLKKAINKSIKKAKVLDGKKINSICGVKFIEDNCAAIVAIIISGNFTDANMHVIRKRLKDVFYTIHVFEDAKNELKFCGSAITKAEMEYFDGLLEELGNFQDQITSLALLNDEWLNLLSTDDRQVLIAIKDKFSSDKNAIKNGIVIKLQSEIRPHLQIFSRLFSAPGISFT